MRAYYKEGFMILKTGMPGPVFIAPHSTMTVSPVLRGDVGTETLTKVLTAKTGSLAVISLVPRAGRYGIDLFREPATMKEALEMFKTANSYDKRGAFEKKYAFYAQDQDEYLEKIGVHNQFWMAAETLCPPNPLYAIMHSQALRIKNFPSVLDVCTNSGRWYSESAVREAVAKINDKYAARLKKIKPVLKRYALYWADTHLRRSIGYRFRRFDLRTMQGSIKTEVMKDIMNASAILKEDAKSLEKDFTWEKYMALLERCIDATDFAVTYQNNFTGRMGEGRISRLIAKNAGSAVMFETSAFMNEMYTKTSSRMVEDILKRASSKKKWATFENAGEKK
ncbi:MAG: hypothetical protein HY365_00340 [Candidatus Aenigmarchaeota archaeon]|nr:hypothetical protein [Candidatus Aenigmarchaeota archaeon]